MEEAYDLDNYLPISFKTRSEQEYITFLWDTFKKNYTSGIYQFAFLAYHMLVMSFIYFNIWRIRQTCPQDFEKGLIGFGRDEERYLLDTSSPFVFSRVNERAVLRLLRLIGCDNAKIGNYGSLVKERNNAAHANGHVFFSTREALDTKIADIMRAAEQIRTHSEPIIEHHYREFLLESHDPDEREFADAVDQIREVLIHGNYMSQKDIEICLSCDISGLGERSSFGQIEALHQSLCESYGTEEED